MPALSTTLSRPMSSLTRSPVTAVGTDCYEYRLDSYDGSSGGVLQSETFSEPQLRAQLPSVIWFWCLCCWRGVDFEATVCNVTVILGDWPSPQYTAVP